MAIHFPYQPSDQNKKDQYRAGMHHVIASARTAHTRVSRSDCPCDDALANQFYTTNNPSVTEMGPCSSSSGLIIRTYDQLALLGVHDAFGFTETKFISIRLARYPGKADFLLDHPGAQRRE
jgi:hypothetical protein